jgi:hypothetical protein
MREMMAIVGITFFLFTYQAGATDREIKEKAAKSKANRSRTSKPLPCAPPCGAPSSNRQNTG